MSETDSIACVCSESQSEALVGSSSGPRELGGVEDQLPVPPNTRASSPQPHHAPDAEGDTLLPYAEPIPPEHSETAKAWIPVSYSEPTAPEK